MGKEAYMDIQSLIQQFSGGGDAAPLEAAAAEHLESMGPQQVTDIFRRLPQTRTTAGSPTWLGKSKG